MRSRGPNLCTGTSKLDGVDDDDDDNSDEISDEDEDGEEEEGEGEEEAEAGDEAIPDIDDDDNDDDTDNALGLEIARGGLPTGPDDVSESEELEESNWELSGTELGKVCGRPPTDLEPGKAEVR